MKKLNSTDFHTLYNLTPSVMIMPPGLVYCDIYNEFMNSKDEYKDSIHKEELLARYARNFSARMMSKTRSELSLLILPPYSQKYRIGLKVLKDKWNHYIKMHAALRARYEAGEIRVDLTERELSVYLINNDSERHLSQPKKPVDRRTHKAFTKDYLDHIIGEGSKKTDVKLDRPVNITHKDKII